jgi:outer membrane protein assembly factor BamB
MRALYILSLITISFFNHSHAQNYWSQFRSADGDGTADVKHIPLEWSQNKNILWKTTVPGKGWSSPIIWEDKVFITTAYRADKKDMLEVPSNRRIVPDTDYRFEVYCLDRKTGEIQWKQLSFLGKPRITTHYDNTYASETPATDGQHVYVYFGMIGLYCYDMEGNKVWEKDLGAYPMEANWGTSSSPILYKDKLIMQFDNEENSQIFALNKMTGEELWKSNRDEISTWSTPYIWENNIRTEVVTGGKKTRSYDPDNGTLLWELDMSGGRDISTPISTPDMIYICNEERSDGGGILFAVKPGARGNISLGEEEDSNEWVAWTLPKSGIAMSSAVLCDGFIYSLERRMGRVNCIDAETGEFAYRRERLESAKEFWASPWAFNNMVFCLDDTGTTHVLECGPEFKVIATNTLDDRFWSSTAVSDGILVFRGVDYIYGIGEAE